MNPQLALRADFRVQEGTTLQHVVDALGDFGKHFGDSRHAPGETLPATGVVPQEELSTDVISLSDERQLILHLEYWELPDHQHSRMMDAMLTALGELALPGGAALELLIVGETGEDEDSKVTGARFIGSTELDRCKARLNYGIDQARPWLEPILGTDEFSTVRRQVLEYSSSGKVLANSLLAG